MFLRNFSLLSAFILSAYSSIFSQNKIGHYSLGFQTGVLMPIGVGKGTSPEEIGISNGLTLKYFPSERFSMGMSLSIMNNRFKGQTEERDIPITQIPFTFDFNWYPTVGRLNPYLGFGAGLSFFTVSPVNGLVNTLKEIPHTYTTPAYLATGKVGLKYQLNYRFSIYSEGIYYLISEPGEAFQWKQNDGSLYRQFSNKASLTFGLLYHFEE